MTEVVSAWEWSIQAKVGLFTQKTAFHFISMTFFDFFSILNILLLCLNIKLNSEMEQIYFILK